MSFKQFFYVGRVTGLIIQDLPWICMFTCFVVLPVAPIIICWFRAVHCDRGVERWAVVTFFPRDVKCLLKFACHLLSLPCYRFSVWQNVATLCLVYILNLVGVRKKCATNPLDNIVGEMGFQWRPSLIQGIWCVVKNPPRPKINLQPSRSTFPHGWGCEAKI